MILYNGQLKILYSMLCRKEHLKMKYEELLEQKSILEQEVEMLKQQSIKEQSDVDKLEYGSLASFLYYVIGTKNKKLSKEKEEAYVAAMKYDAAKSELIRLEAELCEKETELARLQRCDDEYKEVLLLKKARIEAMGHWAVTGIIEYDQRLSYLDNQKMEINEAILAGKYAKKIAKDVLEGYTRAENNGTFNLWVKGTIAELEKIAKVDEAQKLIQELQHSLRVFKTELSDINMDSETNEKIKGWLQFADDFFEDLVADWTVVFKLERSKKIVEENIGQITALIKALEKMKNNIIKESQETQEKLDQLIVQVEV